MTISDHINWKKVSYWDSKQISTIVWSGNILILSLFISIFLYVYFSIFIFIDIGIGVSIFGIISFIIIQFLQSKNAPIMIGYNDKAIFYRTITNKFVIPFKEIKEIYAEEDINKGIKIIKINKKQVEISPGIGGQFGKKILNEYCTWLLKVKNRKSKIVEERKYGIISVFHVEIE